MGWWETEFPSMEALHILFVVQEVILISMEIKALLFLFGSKQTNLRLLEEL
ncbi:MAG: hypothetical protein WC648_04425 [Candidatus Paceibacterota bacterium]|jgi:hypothetical protein